MNNVYSNCIECNSWWDKKNKNKNYKKNIEIENILKYMGLPKEIAQKIISMSNNILKCTYCNNIYCYIHQKQAYINAKYYKRIGALCKDCCWYEDYY